MKIDLTKDEIRVINAALQMCAGIRLQDFITDKKKHEKHWYYTYESASNKIDAALNKVSEATKTGDLLPDIKQEKILAGENAVIESLRAKGF
jgi:hypothetical protein